jgi:hypothetical protein
VQNPQTRIFKLRNSRDRSHHVLIPPAIEFPMCSSNSSGVLLRNAPFLSPLILNRSLQILQATSSSGPSDLAKLDQARSQLKKVMLEKPEEEECMRLIQNQLLLIPEVLAFHARSNQNKPAISRRPGGKYTPDALEDLALAFQTIEMDKISDRCRPHLLSLPLVDSILDSLRPETRSQEMLPVHPELHSSWNRVALKINSSSHIGSYRRASWNQATSLLEVRNRFASFLSIGGSKTSIFALPIPDVVFGPEDGNGLQPRTSKITQDLFRGFRSCEGMSKTMKTAASMMYLAAVLRVWLMVCLAENQTFGVLIYS